MEFLFNSVVIRWLLRRVLELGPTASGLLAWWNAMSPADQATLMAIVQGNWGLVTIGAVISLVGYIWSFIATVTPHATAEGVQVPTKKMTPHQAEKVETAVAASRPRTLAEVIGSFFRKS